MGYNTLSLTTRVVCQLLLPKSAKSRDLGVSRKSIYDFIYVINGNFGRISYHFRDIDV